MTESYFSKSLAPLHLQARVELIGGRERSAKVAFCLSFLSEIHVAFHRRAACCKTHDHVCVKNNNAGGAQ